MHRQITLNGETTIEYFVNAAKKFIPKDFDMRVLKDHIAESIKVLVRNRNGDSIEKIASTRWSREWVKEVDDQYIDALIKRLEYLNNQPTAPFLVEAGTNWLDINTGVSYEKLDILYDRADHGLCTKDCRVFKLSNERDVITATEPTPNLRERPITVSYKDGRNLLQETFDPLQTSEAQRGLDEGLSSKQIAVRVCSNRDAVEELILILKLNEIVGDIGGRAKIHKARRERKDHSSRYAGRGNDLGRRSRKHRDANIAGYKRKR